MLIILLIVILVAPTILAPLLIWHTMRAAMPRIILMDMEAAYAPAAFRQFVRSQQPMLGAMGYRLIACTTECTLADHQRYTAAFECDNQKIVILLSMAFDLDRFGVPKKFAYTETQWISRDVDGTWLITSDADLVRPISPRVKRLSGGRRSLGELNHMHLQRIGARVLQRNMGLTHDEIYAVMIQETISSHEIYDAMSGGQLIPSSWTCDIVPSLTGACALGWSHFGITGWLGRQLRSASLRHGAVVHSDPGQVPAAA